jgi:REP element-mobilizing transposase RayT
MPEPPALAHNYDYHRRLPHYQKADRAIFVTFCRLSRDPFPANARDIILQHCIHDDGKRFTLHVAVVMPDHVHILLTPMRDQEGWPYLLPTILKLIKGVSARSVNKLLGSSGPVWQEESFDHVLRSDESFEEKREYIRQNPVRAGLVKKAEDYQWLWLEQSPCEADTPVRCL